MIRREEWSPADGLALEPKALLAATATGENVVVTAGPGAGKTELLAQRADFLLRTGACPYPRRILAISFKVDAARNLRDRVRSRAGGQHAARFDSLTFHAFAKLLIDNYRPVLIEQALEPDYRIDSSKRIPGKQIRFDDLVPLALEVLDCSLYARGAVRQTYTHVFLDEFQDATDAQYELLKAAFQGTNAELTAVGDVKQRIMGWAGALDGVLETFADDFAARPLALYQNFRSAPRLRRMQNRMIRVMDPGSESPDADLVGDAGSITTLHCADQAEEAVEIADRIQCWLEEATPPSEIALLVRQQARAMTEAVCGELQTRGIAFRNEQESQDLVAEPAASLIFNLIRVVADQRQPHAYAELMRVASRTSVTEEEAIRFDHRLKQLLQDLRAACRAPEFDRENPTSWETIVERFLAALTRPKLLALAPAYQQGSRLDEVLFSSMDAFGNELSVDGDPIEALKRLSELDAVRILTIHKAKGLEFERVILLGVEQELFRGDAAASEFFVAISRAKGELLLTHVDHRARPSTHVTWWQADRHAHADFLEYAEGN